MNAFDNGNVCVHSSSEDEFSRSFSFLQFFTLSPSLSLFLNLCRHRVARWYGAGIWCRSQSLTLFTWKVRFWFRRWHDDKWYEDSIRKNNVFLASTTAKKKKEYKMSVIVADVVVIRTVRPHTNPSRHNKMHNISTWCARGICYCALRKLFENKTDSNERQRMDTSKYSKSIAILLGKLVQCASCRSLNWQHFPSLFCLWVRCTSANTKTWWIITVTHAIARSTEESKNAVNWIVVVGAAVEMINSVDEKNTKNSNVDRQKGSTMRDCSIEKSNCIDWRDSRFDICLNLPYGNLVDSFIRSLLESNILLALLFCQHCHCNVAAVVDVAVSLCRWINEWFSGDDEQSTSKSNEMPNYSDASIVDARDDAQKRREHAMSRYGLCMCVADAAMYAMCDKL